MKTKNRLLLMACAALMAGFTSCSDDNALVESPIVPTEGEPAVVEVTAFPVNSSTRLNLAPTTATPTVEEAKINTATLYIFNANKDFMMQVDMDVDTIANQASKRIELTTNKFYFYVLANYPGERSPQFPLRQSMSSVLASEENVVVCYDGVSKITTPKEKGGYGFLMSSLGDPVEYTLVPSSEADAHINNPVPLPIGRVMAKINTLYDESQVEQPATGKVTDVTYQSRSRYRTYVVPNYSDGSYQIPPQPSPAFGPKQPKTRMFPDMGGWIPNYTYGDDISSYYVKADGNEANAIYVTESTNQEEPTTSNSTFVLLKGTFTPNPEYCYDGNTGLPLGVTPPEKTFWLAASNLTENVYRRRFFYPAPTDEVLAALTAEINDGVDYHLSREYTDGACYYAFYLRDDSQTDRRAKYTTLRNHYYGCTITAITAVGAVAPNTLVDELGYDTPLGDNEARATVRTSSWSGE